jgi:spore coat polysaccharide biosynthesis protein SpsF
MSLVALVQARMSSTRFPGKVLADLAGKPMLWHVVDRTQRARQIDQVCVVTSDFPDDDVIAEFCVKLGVACFRGNLHDVLDRYYQAAAKMEADPIVRITADCPLIDPDVVDAVITMFKTGEYDYVSNTIERTFPDGLDVEVFRFASLKRAWNEAPAGYDREHVTSFFCKHPEKFRIGQYCDEQDRSAQRWTVDYPADLEFVRSVISKNERTGPL